MAEMTTKVEMSRVNMCSHAVALGGACCAHVHWPKTRMQSHYAGDGGYEALRLGRPARAPPQPPCPAQHSAGGPPPPCLQPDARRPRDAFQTASGHAQGARCYRSHAPCCAEAPSALPTGGPGSPPVALHNCMAKTSSRHGGAGHPYSWHGPSAHAHHRAALRVMRARAMRNGRSPSWVCRAPAAHANA